MKENEKNRRLCERIRMRTSHRGRSELISPMYLRYLHPSFSYHLQIAGRPGSDYPILPAVPYTNFYCDEQKYPGFFADTETRCQGKLDFYLN